MDETCDFLHHNKWKGREAKAVDEEGYLCAKRVGRWVHEGMLFLCMFKFLYNKVFKMCIYLIISLKSVEQSF